jgi:glycerol uptake facilitator-like aquaporin
LAEYLGTALLVTAIVGSGISAAALSPADVGVQLLENSIATSLALAVLILAFGQVSGAHFNPVVTAVDWLLGHRSHTGVKLGTGAAYIAAQVVGAVSGAILANVMFGRQVVEIATTHRITSGHLIAEVIATSGLIAVIFGLARSGRAALSAVSVGAYIGAAYWWASSTSFANPAVTVGRVFSDTFAGIAPTSAVPFIVAQIVGGLVGVALVLVLYPDAARHADDVVVSHGPVKEQL